MIVPVKHNNGIARNAKYQYLLYLKTRMSN